MKMMVLVFLLACFSVARAAETMPLPEDIDDFEQSGQHVACWPTAAQLIKVHEKEERMEREDTMIKQEDLLGNRKKKKKETEKKKEK
jgi:hypothetical protein